MVKTQRELISCFSLANIIVKLFSFIIIVEGRYENRGE